MIVMGYMPTLAAVIVTGQTKGKAGIRSLFRKLLMWRVGWRWYFFAIFGLVLIYIAAILLHNQIDGSLILPILSEKLPDSAWPELLMYIVPMFLVIGLINGEELGWRGFALPRLQSKYNALSSSIILGVIWTLFQLPLFFTVTGSSQAV